VCILSSFAKNTEKDAFIMNKVLQDLYRGRIPGWDSQVHSKSEPDEILKKIQTERKHFKNIMSAKNFEKFKELEALHAESHALRYENVYTNAFKMGVLLMCAVFMGDGGKK